MATPAAIEKKRLEQTDEINQRLTNLETSLSEILDLLHQLAAAKSEDPKTAKAKAEK